MSDLLAFRPVSRLLSEGISGPALGGGGKSADLIGTFHDTFKKIMGDVNQRQFAADDAARAFAAGDVQDIHDVALAINKAKFALELTVKVRDKLMEAYRELSAMR